MADLTGQLFGNYRLVRLLGQGGFADVYLAEHIHLDSQVAIKVLQTRFVGNALEQFRNEGRSLASLVHPNIVRVFDFGIENGTPFLVMDYAPNGTLRQHYPKGTLLSPASVLPLLKQIALALQYAHGRKLIHRDIKPENMLLGSQGEVLLSDFGLVLPAQSTGSQTTKEMAGTLPYMAPEQINGKPRPASDQYSLGIVVYEWLSGKRPFEGTFVEVATQHMMTAPTPLYRKVAGISLAMQEVLFTALAKEPQQRFDTIQAFATAFERACQLDGIAPPAFPAEGGIPSQSSLNDASFTTTYIKTPGSQYPTSSYPSSAPTYINTPDPQLLGAMNTQTMDTSLFQNPAEDIQSDPSSAPVYSKTPLPDVLPGSPERPARAPIRAGESSENRLYEQRMPSFVNTLPPMPIVSSSISQPKKGRTGLFILAGILIIALIGSSVAYAILNRPGGPLATISGTATITPAKSTTTPTATSYDLWVQTHGTMFGFDAEHTGFNLYENTLNTSNVSGLTLAWTSDPIGENSFSSPVVSNGLLYVASDSGRLSAIDIATGHIRWASSAESTSSTNNVSTPAVINGVVYICLQDDRLYAFDALSGKLRWVSANGTALDSSPIVVNGVVYVTGNGSVSAFNASTGQLRWTSPEIGSSDPPVAVTQGVVYVSTSGNGPNTGRVSALSAASGQILWTSDLINGGTDSNSSPTVADGLVYIGAGNGGLAAFDTTSGHVRWVTPATAGSTGSSPAVANGVVYITSNKVYAFNASTGATLWTSQTTGAYNADSPEVANGVLYVCSAATNGAYVGSVYALNIATGKVLWTSQPTDGQLFTTPTVANGVVYVASGDQDGKVYAFHLP